MKAVYNFFLKICIKTYTTNESFKVYGNVYLLDWTTKLLFSWLNYLTFIFLIELLNFFFLIELCKIYFLDWTT